MVEIAPRIHVDPAVRSGRPVIAGTRVPVDLMLGKLAAGLSFDDLIREYDITREDILAALEYASRLIAEEEYRAAS